MSSTMLIAYLICAATFVATIIVYAQFQEDINTYLKVWYARHLKYRLTSEGRKHHYSVVIQELKNDKGYNVYIRSEASEHVIHEATLNKACNTVIDYINTHEKD